MKQFVFASLLCAGLAGVVAAQTPAAFTPVVLNVGDKAPEFSLPGTDGKTHTLSAYKGKYVVLAWYPAAFTGGCTAECKSITASSDTITKFDAAYFMASVDTPEKNKQFAEQEQANFPMLSDPGRKTAIDYGVLRTPTGVAQRWTFFIGPDGKIVHIEKAQHTTDAGPFLAAKLEELGVKKKK